MTAAAPVLLDEAVAAEPEAPAATPLRARVLAGAGRAEGEAELDGWLRAPADEALAAWFGPTLLAGSDAGRLRRMLDRDVAELDAVIARAVDTILHHPRLQALEAAWRGVRWLVDTLGHDGMTVVRMMDCRWAELGRDLERSPDFDQSTLFRLIYDEEFGMPGGVPYSMLVGLYDIRHKPGRDRPTDDVSIMRALSRVCAAAFTPMVMGIDPALLGVDGFGELDVRQSLAETLNDVEHRRLKSFQQTSDSRFIALAGPRVLLRERRRGRAAGDCGFRYEERLRASGGDELWGNAALAVAHVCLRAFDEHRWLAAIRGTAPDQLAGGVVAGLPMPDFETDSPLVALKFATEVNVSAALERDMTEAGLICLRRAKDTPFLVFYGLPTLHRPKLNYATEIARVNAELGAMLNYILCVSRFAHYLKVIGREWIGSLKTAEECENKLQNWLHGFCSAGDRLTYETKARYPLQDGRVRVRETPGKPGVYECTMQLKPHFQLDQAISEFQLTTTLAGVEHAL